MAPHEVWLVTGTSRGIGAEFVTRILARPAAVVVACARAPDKTEALQHLKKRHPERLHLITLDASSTTSIQAASKQVAGLSGVAGIDYLINNAALASPIQSRLETSETLRQILEVNVVGVHTIIQSFLPLLQSGKKKTVINISSGSGSLDRRYQEFANRHVKESKHLPTSISYKTSKAALNMLTLAWASDVTPEEGFIFAAIHPGVVATDMNTHSMRSLGYDDKAMASRLTVTESVEQLLHTIDNLTTKDSGRYLNTDGSVIPF